MPPPKKKAEKPPRDNKSLSDQTNPKEALEQTYVEAVAHCITNGWGARRCESSEMFPTLKYSTLQRRLESALRNAPELAKKSALLTPPEERALVEYLVEMNQERAGLGRKGTNLKIVQMLDNRVLMRRLNFNKKYEPLSACAEHALKNGGPGTSRDTRTLEYYSRAWRPADGAPGAQCSRP